MSEILEKKLVPRPGVVRPPVSLRDCSDILHIPSLTELSSSPSRLFRMGLLMLVPASRVSPSLLLLESHAP